MMRLFTCTDHDTHWPVGGASIVIAENEDDARTLLTHALKDEHLDPSKPFTLTEVNLAERQAIVLVTGEY